MIRSAELLQAEQRTRDGQHESRRGDGLHQEGSASQDDRCGSGSYPAEVGSLADIDDVADEVEVEQIDVDSWEHERTHISKTFAPANVLMTNDSLRCRPQMFVGSGGKSQDRDRDTRALQWGDSGDIPGTSSGSQRVPGMKSMFKMYGEVALRKATQTSLLDANDVDSEKCDEAVQATFVDFEPLEEDLEESDFIALDPGQIYSKRKQIIMKHEEWPLYWDRPVDFQEASHILTGAMAVPESKICNSVPQGFRGEGTFVLNCEHINRLDCNNDGLGAWGKPAGRNRYYGHSTCGLFTRMDDGRGNLLPGAKYIWKCMMRRYEHPMTAAVNGGESRFIKKVYSALHPPERDQMVSLIVITYEWIGKPFNFRVNPTSARKRHPYVPGIPHLPVGSKDWQAASFQNGIMAALPATCSAYFGDCPIYAVGAIDFNAVASIILGGTIVESSKICNKVPQGYRECGTFVIDLCNFDSDAELRRDDNGCWGKPAGNSRYYKIDPNTGDAVRVDRGCKLIEGAEYDVQILSKRYEHPSVNGRFVRKIYTGRSPSNSRMFESCVTLAVLTYYWKGEPEYFEAGPQRKVRIRVDMERPRLLNQQYSLQPERTERARPERSPSVKRSRAMEEEEPGEAVQSMIYRTEYELLERQARLLDRFESFMDRLERVSMCLPQIQEPVQQVWYDGAAHDDVGIAHEEEIIVENGNYSEDYAANITE